MLTGARDRHTRAPVSFWLTCSGNQAYTYDIHNRKGGWLMQNGPKMKWTFMSLQILDDVRQGKMTFA